MKSLFIISCIAVLGLLFYFKKHKKSKHIKVNNGVGMTNYGIEVINDSGQTINITDRTLMVLDVISLPYGINGKKSFVKNIVGVIATAPSRYEFNPDRLRPKFLVEDNQLIWEWVPCGNVYSESVSVIVLG